MLRTLPSDSVQCVVTSPPYYGLRDYGTQGQLGLEATPQAYLDSMVAVFREVRRVLRSDGTCWLNIGDSYAGGGGYSASSPSNLAGSKQSTNAGSIKSFRPGKPKDLLMMPARLALALQADGWYIRSDIIWHKPNPMPESVTDRPTNAHEHVFLLTKSPRYYYDAEAVREEGAGYGRGTGPGAFRSAKYVNGRSHDNDAAVPTNGRHGHSFEGGRNARNVWTIATEAYAEAHFATFPTALAERCIKAGTSERGCCSHCGAPWVRQRGDAVPVEGRGAGNGFKREARLSYADANGPRGDETHWTPKAYPTTGWQPSCQCDAPTTPCTVLDPFAGAGTTLLVATHLARKHIGIELNPEYVAMAEKRINEPIDLFKKTDLLAAFDVFKTTRPDLTSEDDLQLAYRAYSLDLAHPKFSTRRTPNKRKTPQQQHPQPDLFA